MERSRTVLLAGGSLALLAGLVTLGSCLADSDRVVDPELSDTGFRASTIHLQWCGDPTTTMRVQWLAEEGNTESETPPELAFREAGADSWRLTTAWADDFPVVEALTKEGYGENPRVFRAELDELEPDTLYEFTILPHDTRYWFRTAPASLEEPMKVVVGGDIDVGEDPEMSYARIREADPLFAAIGGDISYADGVETDRKIQWLEEWSEHMVMDDGRLIPGIAAVGNHEVQGHWMDPELSWEEMRERSPFYLSIYSCLNQDTSYSVVDFGDYMSVFLLDAYHLSKIAGAQTDWLEDALTDRSDVTHLFPVYHVPGYPSVRSFNHQRSIDVRENWYPAFEQHGVRIAFENHDHTYKRTWPMWQGEIADDSGITYVGDGAWGRSLRDPKTDRFYMREGASVYHNVFLEVFPDGGVEAEVIRSENGAVIDAFSVDR